MHRWLVWLEWFVDRAIPYLLILLTALIIGEFTLDMHAYEPLPTIADVVIVSFFVIDLAFKWHRTQRIGQFFRLYWLDVLAVFPFYLVFRAYIEAAELITAGERLSTAQKVTHEALILREAKLLEEARLAELAEKTAKEERLLARGIRFTQRLIRGVKTAHETMLHESEKHRVGDLKKAKIIHPHKREQNRKTRRASPRRA